MTKTYLLVGASVALSAIVRWALNPLLHHRAAFIVFLPALVFSAWIGGWVGGLVALLLSTLIAVCLFLSPTYALFITAQTDQITLVVFLIVGLSVSAIGNSQRKAIRQAEEAAEDARRSAAALRDSEARKDAVVEAALDCIITIDEGGRITGFNPAAEGTFGYTPAEAVGQPVADILVPPALWGRHQDGFAQLLAAEDGPILGKRVELVGLRKGGTEFPAELAVVPMKTGNSVGFTAYLRDITERKALEEEQARLADTNRLLLDSTSQGIYSIDIGGRFTLVNRAAAQMLGFTLPEILGHNGHALIHHSRPDGSPYPEEECPIYHAMRSGESTHNEDEVFWRGDGTSFPVAYSAAPIIEQGTVRGVVVTFLDISERRAMDEERERLAEREHRIAENLQKALQPAIPATVPGLELADYYRPALAEAGVGGDFSDVFAADKGVTLLVVGDLSGKGLAAASQVATVRNMLRFALLNGRSIAGPVTRLNDTLADYGLLSGFATLFVGRYDAQTQTLLYVNCGQDAGLVRRAGTGLIETLPPTGPVLGAISRAIYTEETLVLEEGDVLALFTDGLTEAGPTRAALLTADGVTRLFQEAASKTSASNIVARLMAAVDAYSQNGVLDDQCLLIGVVNRP